MFTFCEWLLVLLRNRRIRDTEHLIYRSASPPDDTVSTIQRNALSSFGVIQLFIIRAGFGAVFAWRYHRNRLPGRDLRYKRIRVVGFICDDILIGISFNQRRSLCNIITVSRYQNKTQRYTDIAEREIQFRRKSASSSSECLCLLSAFFLGAPAAEACARTIVESRRIPEMAPAS